MNDIDKFTVEHMVLSMKAHLIQAEYIGYIQHENSLFEDSDFAICGDTLALVRRKHGDS